MIMSKGKVNKREPETASAVDALVSRLEQETQVVNDVIKENNQKGLNYRLKRNHYQQILGSLRIVINYLKRKAC